MFPVLNYPPVPYPVLGSPGPSAAGSTKRPSFSRSSTLETPQKKQNLRPFVTPFKPVSRRVLSPEVVPRALPGSSPSIPRVPPPVFVTPVKSTPRIPTFSLNKKLYAPFQSPAFRSTPSDSVTPKARLAQLEKRVLLLRQAIKYRKADRFDRNRAGEKAEIELEVLCERWEAGGKAAAELLWEHTSALGDRSGENAGGFSWTYDDGGTQAPTSGGWSSTWGFASSPSQLNTNANWSSSWGFSSTQESQTNEEFLDWVDSEGRKSGASREEMMQQLEDEDTGADRLRALDDQVVHRRASSPSVVEVSEDNAMDLDDPLSSSPIERIDARLHHPSPISSDEGPLEKGDKSEGGDGEKWNMGRMMRLAGVDPSMFGWDDEEEDFSR